MMNEREKFWLDIVNKSLLIDGINDVDCRDFKHCGDEITLKDGKILKSEKFRYFAFRIEALKEYNEQQAFEKFKELIKPVHIETWIYLAYKCGILDNEDYVAESPYPDVSNIAKISNEKLLSFKGNVVKVEILKDKCEKFDLVRGLYVYGAVL